MINLFKTIFRLELDQNRILDWTYKELYIIQ